MAPPDDDAGTVGPEGGTIHADGLRLEIPVGALTTSRQIAVATSSETMPAGLVAHSAVYRFAPEGLTFAAPVTVSFRTNGAAAGAAVYWFEGGTYRRLEGVRALPRGSRRRGSAGL